MKKKNTHGKQYTVKQLFGSFRTCYVIETKKKSLSTDDTNARSIQALRRKRKRKESTQTQTQRLLGHKLPRQQTINY